MPDPDDLLGAQFKQKWQEEVDKVGRFNLAVFGKTGVGKSTLVNAIFGADVAATGIGEPVTQSSHLYVHREGFLGILDTRGLEVGVDSAAIIGELDAYVKQMRRQPLQEQVHLAWYCVRAGDRRFEDVEADFVRELDRLGLPVVLVITQVPARDGVPHPDAVALAREIEGRGLPVVGGRAFLTMALADDFTGQPAHGLQEVLDASFRGAPDAVAGALVAAQRIDMARKWDQAEAAVKVAATSAATAGATPIPFSDAVVLVPIQLAMMARIAAIYGVAIDRAGIASVAASAAATTLGRSSVTSLLKMVPGVGTVAGGAISATVASTFTLAMGYAWMTVCDRLAQGRYSDVDQVLDNEMVRTLFMNELTKRLTGRKRKK